MLKSNDTPREVGDVIDSREPRHISDCVADAVREMADANTVSGKTFTETTYEHLIPCPPFCTYPAGHRFEMLEEDGRQVRYHSPNQFGLASLGPFWLSCEEIATPGAASTKVEVGELMVCVEQHLMGDDGRMTIVEARQTARALTIAADIAEAALRGNA